MPRVVVYGLWHLGCVTAACLAEAGCDTIGLDPDPATIGNLQEGRPPLLEPGLAELVHDGLERGRLSFSRDPSAALDGADVLWVTFDTPVDDDDRADVAFVRQRLDDVAERVPAGAVVLVSSQVPVGFTRSLARSWAGRGLTFACSPENLRLGRSLDAFRKPERVIIGLEDGAGRSRLESLFAPFCSRLIFMSLESAEMVKHSLNAFLGTSVTFINEIARLCEALGADAKEVEQGLRSEPRIGQRAYLSPGVAFSGGTLARDLQYLEDFGRAQGVETPLFSGVRRSNSLHAGWLRSRIDQLLANDTEPVVTLLGLTYRPGTSTLRRSGALELASWLRGRGVRVRAHDPGVERDAPQLAGLVELAETPVSALQGSDLAVLTTEWPQYRELAADAFVANMRQPRLADPNWFLADCVADDRRLLYFAPGRRA